MDNDNFKADLAVLAQANVSLTSFAKYCGFHRVTVSAWIHKAGAMPRGVYREKAQAVLDTIKRGLEAGIFPLRPGTRRDYAAFTNALKTSATI